MGPPLGGPTAPQGAPELLAGGGIQADQGTSATGRLVVVSSGPKAQHRCRPGRRPPRVVEVEGRVGIVLLYHLPAYRFRAGSYCFIHAAT